MSTALPPRRQSRLSPGRGINYPAPLPALTAASRSLIKPSVLRLQELGGKLTTFLPRVAAIFGRGLAFFRHGGYATSLLIRRRPCRWMLARGKSSACTRPREVRLHFPRSRNPTQGEASVNRLLLLETHTYKKLQLRYRSHKRSDASQIQTCVMSWNQSSFRPCSRPDALENTSIRSRV